MLEDVWPTGFATAHAVLAGIWITPLLILWFVSLCAVRRRGDPARAGVAWVKAIYPFWIFSMLCQVVQAGLNIWMSADKTGFAPSLEILPLATRCTFFAARALQNIADVLLFVTFVELGRGFLFCLNGGQKTSIRRYLRYTALGWAVVVLTLAAILLGICIKADIDFIEDSIVDRPILGTWPYSSPDYKQYWQWPEGRTQAYNSRLLKIGRLHTALNCCLWVTSLPTLAFASYVLHKSRENIMLKKAATLFLVSTVLTFCRLLVTMAIYMHVYGSSTDLGFSSYIAYTDIRIPILSTIEAFFNFVLMFVVLTLLFIIAIRKRRGLWSSSQTTWDVSKLGILTTGPSHTSESPCYSDDGLQEHGFCLQPQQAEPSSSPTALQPAQEPRSPSTEPSSPALSQQEAAARHQVSPPISPHEPYRIPRRPLPPPVPHSPTEPDLASDSLPSLQVTRQHDGGFLCVGRQRTIEELDAQKVLLPEGRPMHHAARTSSDDGGDVADGFQMQGHQHINAGQSSTSAGAAEIHRTPHHDPIPRESTGFGTVADGFQMQDSGSVSEESVGDANAAKFQKIQGLEEPVRESDVMADGFQMQIPGPSEPPTYAEAGGETTGTRTRLGYLREKDDQDKKARGRARSF